jgi:ElaB/YqjD/DUF883 family membrane-anchored ribosome-binding protein
MSNTSNMARDASSEAKTAARDVNKAASAASSDIQSDLASLREDVAKLTSQLGDILSDRGSAVWRKAKANAAGVMTDVQDKAMESLGGVREVGDNMVDAIDESLKRRPYTTLALAAAIGFLFGATWRR